MTARERKALTKYKGVVSSKSGDQTIRVVMTFQMKHPKYGQILKRRTVAHVHDPKNEAQVGDTVEITKCRPISKTKNWRLLRIIDEKAEVKV